jgi:hypothetical protein
VYQDGSGVAAPVHVGIVQLEERFPAATSLEVIQVMLLREDHVNWQEPSVLVQGRRKGKGTHTTRLPLVPQAVAALREFFDAKAEGRFSTSSAWHHFAAPVKPTSTRLPSNTPRKRSGSPPF